MWDYLVVYHSRHKELFMVHHRSEPSLDYSAGKEVWPRPIQVFFTEDEVVAHFGKLESKVLRRDLESTQWTSRIWCGPCFSRHARHDLLEIVEAKRAKGEFWVGETEGG